MPFYSACDKLSENRIFGYLCKQLTNQNIFQVLKSFHTSGVIWYM